MKLFRKRDEYVLHVYRVVPASNRRTRSRCAVIYEGRTKFEQESEGERCMYGRAALSALPLMLLCWMDMKSLALLQASVWLVHPN